MDISDFSGDFDVIPTKKKASYTQVIAFSFFAVILIGTFLLALPISSRSGTWTSIFDSLFTATSATCVTGLIVFDTYTHWTIFGQIVIICMIQIGGLGFMSLITTVSIFMGRRISLHERKLLMQSAGNTKIGGMVQLLKRILIGTIIFEVTGAILLATRFCPEMGLSQGIYNAVFHSVSAFCNAGFDLMGKFEPKSSLTHYQNDVIVNLTIASLIIIGGLGFMVWNNIIIAKGKKDKLSLHTKIVLTATAILIVVPTILFYIFEYHGNFAGLSEKSRWLHSFFQAVTPRTAGFNTTPTDSLSESSSALTTILMLIGGSSGSTAGGIKTTTVFVMVLTALASSRRNKDVEVFKRRLDSNTIRQASAITTIYITAVLSATLIICMIEPYSIRQVVYEVSSAIATVGLTEGITPMLGRVSQFILILLMYAGRVGGLSLMLVLAENRKPVALSRPKEEILIG